MSEQRELALRACVRPAQMSVIAYVCIYIGAQHPCLQLAPPCRV